jgi:hypothetical protein
MKITEKLAGSEKPLPKLIWEKEALWYRVLKNSSTNRIK